MFWRFPVVLSSFPFCPVFSHKHISALGQCRKQKSLIRGSFAFHKHQLTLKTSDKVTEFAFVCEILVFLGPTRVFVLAQDYKLQLVLGHDDNTDVFFCVGDEAAPRPLRSAATSSFGLDWSGFWSGVLETLCQTCGEETQTPLSPPQQLWDVCSSGKSQMSHFDFDSGGIWKSWPHVSDISAVEWIIQVSWSSGGTVCRPQLRLLSQSVKCYRKYLYRTFFSVSGF